MKKIIAVLAAGGLLQLPFHKNPLQPLKRLL